MFLWFYNFQTVSTIDLCFFLLKMNKLLLFYFILNKTKKIGQPIIGRPKIQCFYNKKKFFSGYFTKYVAKHIFILVENKKSCLFNNLRAALFYIS